MGEHEHRTAERGRREVAHAAGERLEPEQHAESDRESGRHRDQPARFDGRAGHTGTCRDRGGAGATHLFEKPGALDSVVDLATAALNRWVGGEPPERV
ncbi:hypothetical protein GCM10023094_03700 [Rhodococcus olei]|uniref:Uncharacterized protein n=1 Tax=Rhodococcus olei TaxID=2161675 RepID=A0ABP8NS58_9NOCA